MYSACIFDMDGTLLDTLQDLAVAANHALSAMGFPKFPTESYRSMVGGGAKSLLGKILPPEHQGPATQKLAREIFERYYQQHMQDLTVPYPGIPALLEKLRQQGVKLGVVSNKQDVFIQQMAEHYFPGVFGAVSGLPEGMPPKPDPATTRLVMEQLQADPACTLFIGDSGVDMQTAVNAGLCGCGVLWGFRDEDELRQAGAVHLARDAAELEAIILGQV